jgi:feruloyl esterase
MAEAFYSKPYTKSYYLGCSLGGRQGIGNAEKFPSDFDGIVAGAPGIDFNNLYSWRAHFFPITGATNSSNFIPATAWKTWIHDEVLRQCDMIDKVKDGIIEDPALCDFDPSALLCRENIAGPCLTEEQVLHVTQVYSDYKYPSGELIFPAMQAGSEIGAADGLYAGTAFHYSEVCHLYHLFDYIDITQDWFKYVVYNDPAWNASIYDFSDARAAEALNPANIRTYPSALPGFEGHGGRLLIHHGQQDPQITSFNSNRFYKHLQGKRTNAELDNWFRYFRVSGMNHCSSGPGAWVLGQGGNAAAAGIPFEGDRNVLKAIVDWVEQNIAPEYIEGTKFVNDSESLGVDFTRRHCR